MNTFLKAMEGVVPAITEIVPSLPGTVPQHAEHPQKKEQTQECDNTDGDIKLCHGTPLFPDFLAY